MDLRQMTAIKLQWKMKRSFWSNLVYIKEKGESIFKYLFLVLSSKFIDNIIRSYRACKNSQKTSIHLKNSENLRNFVTQ